MVVAPPELNAILAPAAFALCSCATSGGLLAIVDDHDRRAPARESASGGNSDAGAMP